LRTPRRCPRGCGPQRRSATSSRRGRAQVLAHRALDARPQHLHHHLLAAWRARCTCPATRRRAPSVERLEHLLDRPPVRRSRIAPHLGAGTGGTWSCERAERREVGLGDDVGARRHDCASFTKAGRARRGCA
jgi:hypothetical protein